MKQEFFEAYEKIFDNTISNLKEAFIQRLKAMQICEMREKEFFSSFKSKISDKVKEIENENKEPINLER